MKKKKLFAVVLSLCAIALVSLGMAACQGAQGEKGDKGDKGIQGEAGKDGKDGKDGVTPVIEISADGFWVINGEKTEYKEVGTDGEDGKDGAASVIGISADGFWVIDGEKTEYKAVGSDGQDGDNGRGIESVFYDEDGNLVIVYTDKTNETVVLPEREEHIHSFGEWQYYSEAGTGCGGGLYYKVCTACNAVEWKMETGGEHVWEETYSYDEDTHWQVCKNYGDKRNVEPHVLDDNGDCTVCGQHINGVRYEVSSDKTYATVIGYDGTEGDVTILAEYMGVPVTAIGSRAFSSCEELTSVELPDSIITIGHGAFYNCKNLKEIRLNDGLKTIESEAFNSSGLETIVIPASVENVGTSAFYRCASLKTATFEDDNSLKIIANFLFFECAQLENVVFGKNSKMDFIGNSSFDKCVSLKSIDIPEGVTVIAYGAFEGCSGLQSIKFPSTLQTLSSHSFYDCTSLTAVEIPAATVSINHNSFTGCDALREIVVETGNPTYHSDGNCIIETAAKKLAIGCSGSVLPQDDSVTEIGTWAFGDNPCLKKIEIFRYIQKIDIMSFYNCGGLEEIVVDKDNPVFHEAGNCLIETQTKTLLRFGSNGKIPSDGSVTGIQDGAFGGCFIRNLYIPACIQSFVISGHGIAGLETVSVEEGNAVYYSSENCLIEKSTQTLCVGCKNSVIPSGVKRIKTGAFEGSEIASINIPVSVTCIESFAFLDCADLTEIRYEGTTEQWNALEKNGSWDKNTGNYVVNCSDGTLIKK